MNMKTLAATIFIGAALTLVSCLDDADNKAKATLNYAGTCHAIRYTDSTDVTYQDLIIEALASRSIGLIGPNSQFEEHGEIDYPAAQAAYLVCDEKARETFKKHTEGMTLTRIKAVIYTAHADSLDNAGYTSPSTLPLHQFTAQILLHNSVSDVPVDTVSVTFHD